MGKDFTNGVDASGGIRTALRTTQQLDDLEARPGFDNSTGLGVPNGYAFLRALAPGAPLLADTAKLTPAAISGAPQPSSSGSGGTARTCTRVVKLTLPRRRGGLVRVAVYVDGIRATKRTGRNLRHVRVRRPASGRVAVLIKATSTNGRHVRVTRTLSACPA